MNQATALHDGRSKVPKLLERSSNCLWYTWTSILYNINATVRNIRPKGHIGL